MARNHKCSHLENIVQLSLPELCKIKQGHSCSECDIFGPNLWICLHRNCLHIGCSEQANDHSTKHFKFNHQHCIHMNLSSQRIWCYLCETEVFLPQRRNSIVSNDSSDTSRYSERIYERAMSVGSGGGGESPESSGDEDDGDRRHLDGLVGLQNIANTCYMNAALQALSNSPPLTTYFLDCGDIIEATSELTGNQRKIGLAKSYHRLMKEMWCRNKRSNGYVVPRGILYGIRSVHPMFRGFQQHDTQEFLRCFMDQLHEELKEVTPPPPDILVKNNVATEENDDNSPCSSPSPSQSEAEYETCDSGVSEQSSLSDEIPASSGHRSPSPTTSTTNQRYNTYSTKAPISNSNSETNVLSSPPQSPQNLANTPQSKVNSQSDKSPPKPPHRSIISDVFDGKLLSSVQCLTCDRISTREETFQDLSLPIPGKDHLAVLHQSQGISVALMNQPPPSGVNCTDAVYQVGQDGWIWWLWNWFKSWFWGPMVSLHDCLAAFFSADELKGDNMYSCEKCNKLRNGIKYSRVLALPEMLCIHLKRFRHDLSYSSKISSPVNFPLTGLDMRPYLHKDCKSEIYTYDLTAVICHHGTVGGGHYTSFAKHELTGKWFEFDDQLVTEVSPDVVQNCQAYVLFYRKSNPQMSIVRAEALELADTNPPQASDIRFFVSRQWLSRFNTFAEPGPIDNWALLCPHGGLPPVKAALISRLAVPLPQPLWDFLYKKFGGGPACNHLFECDICRLAAESLTRRQRAELAAFTQYNDEFQYQETPTTIYAISMAWFRQWQMFARGVTTEEPGPINNATIAAPSETVPIRNVRPGSDYAQINTTLWKFFYGIYGGGPEIILRGGPAEDTKISKDKEADQMDIDPDSETGADSTFENANTTITPEPDSRSSANSICPPGMTTPPTPTAVSPSVPQPVACVKPMKSVSFEDETELNSLDTVSTTKCESNRSSMDENEHVTSTTVITPPINVHHTSRHSGTKRGKHYSSTSSSGVSNSGSSVNPDLLLGKKDKRYRGAMKSSGFFGPEGTTLNSSLNYRKSKYYTHPYHQTSATTNSNIPDDSTTSSHIHSGHSSSQSTNHTPANYSFNANDPTSNPNPNQNSQIPSSPDLNSNGGTSPVTTMNQMNKRTTEEVTPLLHHRRYPSSTMSTQSTVIPSTPGLSSSMTQSESETIVANNLNADQKSPVANRSSSNGTSINVMKASSYRKKLKSKSGRKYSMTNHHSNHNDVNASDSG
ncbi:ubiquitin carboxyl-terminal hydrolase 20 isoform X2 [Hermetia illucens]|uniref:ubiquitin carboxyl-terminal hydrolase 20 isoform X2 n=1 Tax=Hermetia illucens TaxID=343691 RepID=UPI0018CC2CDC|nr:ubiquitin carboxyl-terminal hydrolase 20 isoform X2 [Hermetia illucens]